MVLPYVLKELTILHLKNLKNNTVEVMGENGEKIKDNQLENNYLRQEDDRGFRGMVTEAMKYDDIQEVLYYVVEKKKRQKQSRWIPVVVQGGISVVIAIATATTIYFLNYTIGT